MVRTGDQADDKVSRQIAPYTEGQLVCEDDKIPFTVHTVWLLTFGCHTLVSNFIIGGRKGYSPGILISILYVPPSYGVPGGPLNEPLRCIRPSLPSAGSAEMFDIVSE